MEDSLIVFLVMFSVSIVTFGVIYLTKSRDSKRKKPVKSVETENVDSIIKSYENSMEILKIQNEFLMADSKQTKKRLANQMGINMRQNESELEVNTKISSKNLEDDYEIDLNNGVKLAKSMNLPFLANMNDSKIPELINNPLIKGKVWEYIKDHKDEMIDLGVIIPKGSVQQKEKVEEEKEIPEKGMMNLTFDDNNSKHMA